jgi:hypothetical protein
MFPEDREGSLRRWRSRASQMRRTDFLTADKSMVLLSDANFLRLAARPHCSAQASGDSKGNFSTPGRTALSVGAQEKAL